MWNDRAIRRAQLYKERLAGVWGDSPDEVSGAAPPLPSTERVLAPPLLL
jgi:hypothetical protein